MSESLATEETRDEADGAVGLQDAAETGAESPAATEPQEYTGPVCEKCGVPATAAACPKCGWYPSINAYVEIDETYERLMETVEPTPEEAAEPTKPDWQKHLEVWQGAIPGWAWAMLATTAGIVAAAIAARVATVNLPETQTLVGVATLAVGLLTFGAAHLVGFVLCSGEDATIGMADILIKPTKCWKQLLSALPERLWLTNTANVGLTATLSAVAIVGGIPYERLLDWGFKAAPKKTLVAMIAEQAANAPGNGSDSLEGAIGDFAGKAGDTGKPGGKPKPATEPPAPREKLECLIVGYRIDEDDRLTTLLLASDVGGRLRYVGAVSPPKDAEESAELLTRFAESHATRPFVRTTESGQWLRPRFTCKVTYSKWPKGKRPRDLQWEELLDEVKLPW